MSNIQVGDVYMIKPDQVRRYSDAVRAKPWTVTKVKDGDVCIRNEELCKEWRDETFVQWYNVEIFENYFEKVESKKMNQTMTFETARTQRNRLIEQLALDPKAVRVRSRTWDVEGLYAAVEVGGESLYTVEKVEDYIERSTPFVDVTVQPYGRTALFTAHDEQGNPLRNNKGGILWSEETIQAHGGVVRANGKRYRLGRSVFEPFVKE